MHGATHCTWHVTAVYYNSLFRGTIEGSIYSQTVQQRELSLFPQRIKTGDHTYTLHLYCSCDHHHHLGATAALQNAPTLTTHHHERGDAHDTRTARQQPGEVTLGAQLGHVPPALLKKRSHHRPTGVKDDAKQARHLDHLCLHHMERRIRIWGSYFTAGY